MEEIQQHAAQWLCWFQRRSNWSGRYCPYSWKVGRIRWRDHWKIPHLQGWSSSKRFEIQQIKTNSVGKQQRSPKELLFRVLWSKQKRCSEFCTRWEWERGFEHLLWSINSCELRARLCTKLWTSTRSYKKGIPVFDILEYCQYTSNRIDDSYPSALRTFYRREE